MKRLMGVLRKLFGRAQSGSFETNMQEEIRFHMEMRARRNREAGMNDDAAREHARRSFGHMDGVREACRDQRRFEPVREILKDTRYGWRIMMRMPALTAAAALALGVGIGLMSVELSFVRGVRSNLPIRDAERVREIRIRATEGFGLSTIARRDYESWRTVQRSFSDTGAITLEAALELSEPGRYARSYSSRGLSSAAVRTLGVAPALGRAFGPEDDRASSPLQIVLSHEIWVRDFGASPDIVGRRFRTRAYLRRNAKEKTVAPEDATVVGVMPPGFALRDNVDCWINASGSGHVTVLARLKEGVRPEAADAELATQGAGFEVPDGIKVRGLSSQPLNGGVGDRITILLSTLFGVVMGVMALACVNVGTLLTMRALERGRELALRMALGATRGRLIRQMLVESALLAVLAAAVGIPIAWAGVNLLDRQLALDPSKPTWIRLQLDGVALVAMLLASLVAALIAGLAPALRTARMDASAALKNGSWSSGMRLGRASRWLVTFQSAAACALLLVTGLLLDGLIKTGRLDAKSYDPQRVLSARVQARRYETEAAAVRALREALERARALPGVQAAALSHRVPMTGTSTLPVMLRGAGHDDKHEPGEVSRQVVSPEYFAVMGAGIRAGRVFTAADSEGGEQVAIVSESMARHYWPGRSPLGREFRSLPDDPWFTIVGVCADLPSEPTDRTTPGATYYRPLDQVPSKVAFLLLRTRVDPHGLIRPLRDAIREFDPDLPIDGFLTVEEAHDRRVATPRALAALAAAFALSALALAAVGIYGVTGFSVRKRTREFGIRVALGASPLDMARLTLGRGLLQLTLSLSAGALLGWWASRPMLKTLKGMAGEVSPESYAIILGVVAASTFAALWLPARQAIKVDPAQTLRAE
jgi:putative ABC transport system permease protein